MVRFFSRPGKFHSLCNRSVLHIRVALRAFLKSPEIENALRATGERLILHPDFKLKMLGGAAIASAVTIRAWREG